MTHYKLLTNPNYIGSYALQDDDDVFHELAVTITGYGQEMVHNGNEEDECLVLQLKDQLPMILKATNQKSIAKALGTSMVEKWVGKTIVLFVTKIKVKREFIYAMRVRDVAATATSKQALDKTHPKWAEAVKAVEAGNATIAQIKKRFSLTEEIESLLTQLTQKADGNV